MSPEPHDDDWVRDILAEVGREPEPAPAWVDERIARTLRELADEQPASAPTPATPPTPMTPRRHRRWAGALLAAAALTVGGYSLTATGLLGSVSGGGAESATSGDSAGAEAEVADAPPSRAGLTGSDVLSSRTLRADARELVRDAVAIRAPGKLTSQGSQLQGYGEADDTEDGDVDSGGASRPQSDQDELDRRSEAASDGTRNATKSSGACRPPPASVPGVRRPVVLDDAPATAVVRTLPDGRSKVQIWACDAAARLAQITVRP